MSHNITECYITTLHNKTTLYNDVSKCLSLAGFSALAILQPANRGPGWAHHSGLRFETAGQGVRRHGVDQQSSDVISLRRQNTATRHQRFSFALFCGLCVCLNPPHWGRYRGQVQRRLAFLILHGGVGAMGEQQGTQLGPTLLGRLVQRCEGPLVGGVDARVVLDQQGGDVHMLVRRWVEEWKREGLRSSERGREWSLCVCVSPKALD